MIELHTNAGYLDVIASVFVSYDVCFLDNRQAKNVCNRPGIPFLAWTIRNEDDEKNSKDW